MKLYRYLFLALGLVVGRSASAQGEPQPLTHSTRTLCADALRDASNSANCIPASSIPMLGGLFPLTELFFVNPSTGYVGIGTTFPFKPLEVVGGIAMTSPAGVFKGLMRPSNSKQFGIVETLSPTGSIPTVTNLLSTVSIDPDAGALATVNDNLFLTALTTPGNNSSAGFVAVFNSNVEIAGINGGTGIVFGTAKSFVQPHPVDPTKEIQYVSLEGPEHGVYFRGTAQLVDGEALLSMPESFRLVAREEGLTVSLTPLGQSRGLFVARKGLQEIVVRENEGGNGDVAFDFLVMGVRAAMPEHVAIHENTHFSPRPGSTLPEGSLPAGYRELLIQNGTLNSDGSVNEVQAAGLGWRFEKGGWTGGKRASAPVALD